MSEKHGPIFRGAHGVGQRVSKQFYEEETAMSEKHMPKVLQLLHQPIPWTSEPDSHWLYDAKVQRAVAIPDESVRAFVLRAVNSHEALREALSSVMILADSFVTGMENTGWRHKDEAEIEAAKIQRGVLDKARTALAQAEEKS